MGFKKISVNLFCIILYFSNVNLKVKRSRSSMQVLGLLLLSGEKQPTLILFQNVFLDLNWTKKVIPQNDNHF